MAEQDVVTILKVKIPPMNIDEVTSCYLMCGLISNICQLCYVVLLIVFSGNVKNAIFSQL